MPKNTNANTRQGCIIIRHPLVMGDEKIRELRIPIVINKPKRQMDGFVKTITNAYFKIYCLKKINEENTYSHKSAQTPKVCILHICKARG